MEGLDLKFTPVMGSVMLQLIPPKIGPPGPFMAATAGLPTAFAALQMVPPTQLWCRGWFPFPQLVSRIIQCLLLFNEPWQR